jgi:hypothetical protein
MRIAAAVAVVFAATVAIAPGASAQEVTFRGFADAGQGSTVNGSKFGTFGGGLVVDLGQPWFSAGAQGEALTSGGYYAGRGAVFGQVNPLGRSPFRPFVLGGYGFGEEAGPLVAAGLEVRPAGGRLGFRLAVEDYMTRGGRYGAQGQRLGEETRHQVSVKVGVMF